MKQMHVYEVYLDDGHNCYKEIIPAPSKKDAIAYCEGNGDVVAVRNSEWQDIDLNRLVETLKLDNWGDWEIAVITRCLDFCGLRRD